MTRRIWGYLSLVTVLLLAALGFGCTGAGLSTSGLRDAINPVTTTASESAIASGSPAVVRAVPTSITVVPASADINVPAPAGFAGPRIPSSVRLTGTVYNSDGSISTDILWTASNPRVARIDPDGVVTSLLPAEVGTVIITGSSRLNPSLIATASIKVADFGPAIAATPAPPPPRKPISVLIFPQVLDLNTPAEATAPLAVRYPSAAHLVGTVFWSDGTLSDDVLWSSSNPMLVAISATGSVRSLVPNATGSVVITAAARASVLVTATATVNVKNLGPNPNLAPSPVPSSVVVFPTAVTVNGPPETGQSATNRFPGDVQFQATVFMTDGALTGDVFWQSSNPQLVKISTLGVASSIIPHATGSAVITAFSRLNQAVLGTASVTVADLGPAPTPTPVVTVSSVTIFPGSATINTPYDGGGNQPSAGFPTSVQFTGTVIFSNNSLSSDILWSSSNANIATVDQLGLVTSTMIRSTGTVTITAQSRLDPTKKATATVSVVDNGKVEIDVQ